MNKEMKEVKSILENQFKDLKFELKDMRTGLLNDGYIIGEEIRATYKKVKLRIFDSMFGFKKYEQFAKENGKDDDYFDEEELFDIYKNTAIQNVNSFIRAVDDYELLKKPSKTYLDEYGIEKEMYSYERFIFDLKNAEYHENLWCLNWRYKDLRIDYFKHKDYVYNKLSNEYTNGRIPLVYVYVAKNDNIIDKFTIHLDEAIYNKRDDIIDAIKRHIDNNILK